MGTLHLLILSTLIQKHFLRNITVLFPGCKNTEYLPNVKVKNLAVYLATLNVDFYFRNLDYTNLTEVVVMDIKTSLHRSHLFTEIKTDKAIIDLYHC